MKDSVVAIVVLLSQVISAPALHVLSYMICSKLQAPDACAECRMVMLGLEDVVASSPGGAFS